MHDRALYCVCCLGCICHARILTPFHIWQAPFSIGDGEAAIAFAAPSPRGYQQVHAHMLLSLLIRTHVPSQYTHVPSQYARMPSQYIHLPSQCSLAFTVLHLPTVPSQYIPAHCRHSIHTCLHGIRTCLHSIHPCLHSIHDTLPWQAPSSRRR